MKKIILIISIAFIFILTSIGQAPHASAQCEGSQTPNQCIFYDTVSGQCLEGSCCMRGDSNCGFNDGTSNCGNSVNCGSISGCSTLNPVSCPVPPGGGGGGGIITFPPDLPLRKPSSTDPTSLIGSVVTFIIYVLAALGVIASIIWLLYGAIKYVTAGGDKAAIEGAKTHVITALVGLIIVLFTFVIISLVLSVFGTGGLSGINFQLPPLF